MSNYVLNIGSSIVKALEGVPRAQPAQAAGYWANIDFWLLELAHLVAISESYEDRASKMKQVYDAYLAGTQPHNHHDFGGLYQSAAATTSPGERKRMVGSVRASILHVADRALDLRIISLKQYDDFVEQLRAI